MLLTNVKDKCQHFKDDAAARELCGPKEQEGKLVL